MIMHIRFIFAFQIPQTVQIEEVEGVIVGQFNVTVCWNESILWVFLLSYVKFTCE